MLCLLAFPMQLFAAEPECRNHSNQKNHVSEAPLLQDSATRMMAGKLFFDGENAVRLTGQVKIQDHTQLISAESARYNKQTEYITASGGVHYQTPGLSITGTRAEANLASEVFSIEGARYQYETSTQQVHGRAASVAREESGVLILNDASYTSCPPGENGWRLEASQVNIDQNSQSGSARHIRLYFKDMPFFYFPWFGFPVGDQRKTGFLAPNAGHSSRHGYTLSTPWYWNIAPQADATLTPRYMEERGTQLQSEFRHLNIAGLWQLEADYLDDDLMNDKREFSRIRQAGHFGERWRSSIDASYASDKDYFDDFGNEFSVEDIEHLERRADLKYSGDWFDYSLMAQGHQALDPDASISSRPYRRLPQLRINSKIPVRANGIKYGLKTEWVRFDRDESITGERLFIKPTLSWEQRQPGWYTLPAVSLWHHQYRLGGTFTDDDETPAVTAPVFSFDSGLFFDRHLQNGGTHTLEPRLFYLYAAHKDQSDFPDFDSDENSFSFSQLFRDNRFSGFDRIGDANQLALALTSRVISDKGVELAKFSVGRLHYFRDREVVLGNAGVDTAEASDFVLQTSLHLASQWRLGGDLQWQPDTEKTISGSSSLAYNAANKNRFSIGHRYRSKETDPDEREAVEMAFNWQLFQQFSISGKVNYGLRTQDKLEQLIGIQYDSCCWALRVIASEEMDEGEAEKAYYLQWVLKGLTSLGDNVGGLFE